MKFGENVPKHSNFIEKNFWGNFLKIKLLQACKLVKFTTGITCNKFPRIQK